MYYKNDLEVCEFNHDSREDGGYEEKSKYAGRLVIILPHSCDEWVVGGVEEAEQMILDLQQAIQRIKESQFNPSSEE